VAIPHDVGVAKDAPQLEVVLNANVEGRYDGDYDEIDAAL